MSLTGSHLLQVLQACSVQHLPVPYAAFPPLLSSDPFLLHPPHLSPHHAPHLPPPGQFVPFQTQQSRSVGSIIFLKKESLEVGSGSWAVRELVWVGRVEQELSTFSQKKRWAASLRAEAFSMESMIHKICYRHWKSIPLKKTQKSGRKIEFLQCVSYLFGGNWSMVLFPERDWRKRGETLLGSSVLLNDQFGRFCDLEVKSFWKGGISYLQVMFIERWGHRK